jgi:hypothetical protein
VGGEGNGADSDKEETGKEDANQAVDKNKPGRRAHRAVGERRIGDRLSQLFLHGELDLADR